MNSWKLEHSDFLTLLYEHNIVFLTETWKRDDNTKLLYNNVDFIEYNVCRKAVKTAKRNSGGITVLIRKELEKYIEHIKSYSDGIVWFKLFKEHLKTDRDIYLCCAHIPPKNSSRHLLNDENIFDILYDDILKYNELGNCIIYGDMNSRCGALFDYIDITIDSEDIECMIYGADTGNKVMPRSSEDTIVNEYGRKLIDMCISHDLLIVNGRAISDPKGSYTCYTHNGSSLVDYVICSRDIIDWIDLRVEDINPLSDHCILTTNISLNTPMIYKRTTPDTAPTCNIHTHIPYRWKQNFREEYETNIESIAAKTQLHNIYDALHDEQITQHVINRSVMQLSDVIRDASKKCTQHVKPTRQTKNIDMPWHDIECKTYRNTFMRAKSNLKKHKNTDTLNAVQDARTTYSKCCRVKKQYMTDRLRS